MPVPDFEGISLRTAQKQTKQEFFGKPWMMVFVSPGCKPCWELLSDWCEIQDRYQDRVRFVLMVQGTRGESKQMLESRDIRGEAMWDRDQEIFHALQVRVTPFGFALDETGMVKAKGLCGGSQHLDRLISSIIQQHDSVSVTSFSREQMGMLLCPGIFTYNPHVSFYIFYLYIGFFSSPPMGLLGGAVYGLGRCIPTLLLAGMRNTNPNLPIGDGGKKWISFLHVLLLTALFISLGFA